MILDIIILAITALMVFIGVKRGIARSLYNLVSICAAAALSGFLGKLIAKWFFDTAVAPSIEKSVADALTATADGAGELSQSIADNLPGYLKGMLALFGVPDDIFASSITQSADNTVKSVTDVVLSACEPAVTAVLSTVLIVVLFLLIFIILKLISRFVLKLFDLPVISFINSLLGGALGLLEGAALCFAAVLLCRIFLPYASDSIITPELIEQSVAFKAVYFSDFAGTVCGILPMGSNADIAATEATTALNTQ